MDSKDDQLAKYCINAPIDLSNGSKKVYKSS